MTDWKHKEVFVLLLNDAIMSGKTGCSLSKINDNNVRRNRLQICRISPSYQVISRKIAGYPIYHAIVKHYNTTFRQTTSS